MTVQSKTTIKSYFQTGDRPTEAQFIDLIDSYQDTTTSLVSLSSATVGTVGRLLLSTATTAAAQQQIGGGTTGRNIFQAATTAAVVSQLGATSVGTQLLQSATTAAANSALGGGAVGVQIYQAATTAAVQNIVASPTVQIGTVTSATGTSVVIPVSSNARAVHVGFMNVSTNGTSNYRLVLNSDTSAYTGTVSVGTATINWTDGVLATQRVVATAVYSGVISLRLMDQATNTWCISGIIGDTDTGTGPYAHFTAGQKSLGSTLSSITVNTVSTDTFDAGRFNVQQES